MKYEFKHCDKYIEVDYPIKEGPPKHVACPECGENMKRVYNAPPVKYNTQGFHATDYDAHGDKLERMNKTWSETYGEKPPEPARDIPKNSSDPY